MSTATNGRAREHRTRDRLTDDGWVHIMRAAASKGPADLLMGHPEHGGALIQVGTGSKAFGCTLKDCDHNGGTAAQCARDRFVDAAELISALPLLAIWTRAGVTYWHVTRDTASTWQRWEPCA